MKSKRVLCCTLLHSAQTVCCATLPLRSSAALRGRGINELRGVTVPVKLSGPFEEVAYSIGWGRVAKEALKSQTAEQLKEKLQPKAQDLLKGLLER